jgi:hypothetical protein
MLNSFLIRAKGFLKENPGSIPILGFQALLVACAILLVYGLSVYAETVADVAYFLLVAGVVVQLALFVRRGSSGE